MSTSAIIMMMVGLGVVWGGTIVTIAIALAADKGRNGGGWDPPTA